MKKIAWTIIALLLVCSAESKTVRVGIFPVNPLNFMDEDGVAQGLNPDLLREIEKRRDDLNFEFVSVTWAEGLEKLQTEAIDLMVSVSYTEERSKIMSYTRSPVMEIWGQIFVRPDSQIVSTLDLRGKHVGIMRKDINGQNFMILVEAFGVPVTIKEFATHDEVFAAIEAGTVDVGVTPNHFGRKHSTHYHLVGTSIQFSPTPIYFAAKRGTQGPLLREIDDQLIQWKADENSFYYERLTYWLGANQSWVKRVPLWIWVVVGGAIGSSLFLLAVARVLNYQVKVRTDELATSESRYRILVENQMDLVVKIGVDGRYLFANTSYCDLFGKTKEELLGQTFLPRVHEDDQAATEAMEPPYHAYLEQRAMTKAGCRWLAWQDTGILDEHGNLIEIIAVGHDITERKESELALQESKERYKEIFNASNEAVVIHDAQAGDILDVNAGMLKMFGVDKEEALSLSIGDISAGDPEATQVAVKEVIQKTITEGPQIFEWLAKRKSGEEFWTEVSLSAIKILGGQQIQAVVRDVSERKSDELAIQASNERLSLATKAAHVGFWELDLLTDRLVWDEQIALLYDVDAGKREGNSADWILGVHPDDLDRVEGEFQEMIATNCPFDTEFRVVWQDGSIHHLHALAGVEQNAEGVPERVYGSNWDVSQSKRMVTALRESEQSYRQLFENMTVGFLLLEVVQEGAGVPSGYKIIQLNPATEQMLDVERSKLIGHSLFEIFKPEESHWLDVFAKVAMTGSPSAYENRIESLDRVLSTWIFVPKPNHLAILFSDNTARRMAEEAVLRAQQQLQHILDNTRDVIFQIDLKGNYTYANSAVAEVTGYSLDQFLTMNIMDLITPEHRPEAEGRLKNRVAGISDVGNYSFEIFHHNGHRIWLELATNGVYDADGKLDAIQGVARDITDRKASERELKESQRFLRTILDSIPSRVFWKDLASNYLGCNVSFAQDSGFNDSAEVVGKSDDDLCWTKEEADSFKKDDYEVMASGVSRLNYEEELTQPEGICFLNTSKVPLRNEEGSVIGVLGVYDDITERKQMEKKQLRLTAAINQSTEAIMMLDTDEIIQYVNPAFETVTGYPRQEIIGQPLSVINAERRAAEFYSRILKKASEGKKGTGRIVNMRKEGTRYTAEVAVTPVRSKNGNTVNYVVTIHDVTQEVEMEAHLRQAQKMDAVGRLAGGVAHDFNNILQSILGFSGILLTELEEGTSQYNDVSEIRTAARRAGELTRQLLTLSRKQNIDYTAQNLNEIINRNEGMMHRLLGDKIEFIFKLKKTLKPIRADVSQMEQVILNLFINARDAMPDGGRLLVSTRNVGDEDEEVDGLDTALGFSSEYICLSISDTGMGIRKDVIDHVFEPFFTTKKVGEGTGLGLSVVYGIVQQHGGWIDVASKIGEGAMFSVYLPVLVDGDLVEPVVEIQKTPDGHGESILVVEDESVLRELNERMLSNAGYVVESAGSQQEAIEKIGRSDGQYDLLFSNMILSDGTGLELAKLARQTIENISVLFCSGRFQDSTVHDAIKSHGYRYLEKPVATMHLLQTIREMLDEKKRV